MSKMQSDNIKMPPKSSISQRVWADIGCNFMGFYTNIQSVAFMHIFYNCNTSSLDLG